MKNKIALDPDVLALMELRQKFYERGLFQTSALLGAAEGKLGWELSELAKKNLLTKGRLYLVRESALKKAKALLKANESEAAFTRQPKGPPHKWSGMNWQWFASEISLIERLHLFGRPKFKGL